VAVALSAGALVASVIAASGAGVRSMLVPRFEAARSRPPAARLLFSSNQINDGSNLADIYTHSIGVLGVARRESRSAPAANSGSGTSIFSIAGDGSDLRELTTSPGSDLWPAPSPDGSRIAFVRDELGYDSLYVMRSDGSDQTQLWHPTPPPGVFSDALGQPMWSPDGKTLLVAEHVTFAPRAGGTASLWLVPLDGAPAHTVGPGWANAIVTGAFSPDARYIAYQTYNDALFTDRERVGVIAPDGTWRSFGRGTLAAWSPRADRLAYIASPTSFLTVVGPDGRHRWTLRTRIADPFAWSPSGRQIALLPAHGATPTLFTVHPGAPRLRRVIALPAGAFVRSSIYSGYGLSWSRDSHWLAATSDSLILLVRPDGTGFQAISGSTSTVWAPTGHTLVFIAPDGLASDLLTWPTGLSVDQAPASRGYQGVTWSPDGTRLIFARGALTP
jgi:Tol biopolymer transport system component